MSDEYRYTLTRQLKDIEGGGRTVLFVMLNPSTADETTDDPTIRRCIGFASRWGFDRLAVGNLYALRATNPKRLFDCAHPVGALNDWYLENLAKHAQLTIIAWGSSKHPHPAREGDVTRLLRRAPQPEIRPLRCLGYTKAGHPRHPLYVRGDTRLMRVSI